MNAQMRPLRKVLTFYRAGLSAREKVCVTLFLVMALGAVLRFWGLAEVSVWGDEYFGNIISIRATSLSQFINLIRPIGTSQAPLHPVLQFMWSHIAGVISIRWIRSFNVILSIITIPVTFWLGRSIGGRNAGVIAALCAALSFSQVFHGQSIRPYALFMLLAGLSMLSALWAIQGVWSRQWLGLLANILGMLTHWMFVLVIASEFVAMLILARNRRRFLLRWSICHLLWLAPLGIYVVCHPPINVHFEATTLTASDVFDAITRETTVGFDPRWRTVDGVPRWLHKSITGLPQVFSVVSVISLVVIALAGGGNARSNAGPSRHRPTALIFFLIQMGLPPAILAVVNAYSGMPVFQQRYFPHVSLVSYAIVGAAVARVSGPWLRRMTIVALMCSLMYSSAQLLSSVRTTDYLGVVRFLRNAVRPGEFVVVDSYSTAQNLDFHMEKEDPPVFCASNVQVVKDIALWTLCPRDGGQGDDGSPGSVWYVHNCDWDSYEEHQVDQDLNDAGLGCETWRFPEMQDVVVRKLRYDTSNMCEGEAGIPSRDEADLLRETEAIRALFPEVNSEIDEIIARLRGGRLVIFEGPWEGVCLLLLMTRRYTMTSSIAAYRCTIEPGPELEYLRVLADVLDGDAGMESTLMTACRRDSVYLRFLGGFSNAVAKRDFASAFREASRLHELGHPYGLELRETMRHASCPGAPALPMGFAPLAEEDYDVAARWLRPDSAPAETGVPRVDRALAEVAALMGDWDNAIRFLKSAQKVGGASAVIETQLRSYEAKLVGGANPPQSR